MSCDKKDPCYRCASRGVSCTYSRREASIHSLSHRLSDGPQRSKPQNDLIGSPGPFKATLFLSLTDPYVDTMAGILAVEGAQTHTRDHIGLSSGFSDSGLMEDESLQARTPPIPDTERLIRWKSHRATYGRGDDLGNTTDVLPSWLHCRNLDSRLQSIVLELSRLGGSPGSSTEKQIFDVDHAQSIFSVDNLIEFILAYFLGLHHHFPFLHRPTFCPQEVASPLLLAIFLAGSASSAPRDHALAARQFFFVGEVYIYGCLENYLRTFSGKINKEGIEILQAALLINSIENQLNDPGIRRRVRTQGHTSLVAALRALKILSMKHDHASRSSWHSFMEREACIRFVAAICPEDNSGL